MVASGTLRRRHRDARKDDWDLSPDGLKIRKWFQVTRRPARSPTGMHGQNPASEDGVTFALCSPPPVFAGHGSMLRCASAFSISGRSSLLDAAFRSPTATADLAIRLRGRVNAPGLRLRCDSSFKLPSTTARSASRSRPRPAFCRLPRHVHTHVARCQVRYWNSPPVVGLSAPLQDLSIPSGSKRSTRFQTRKLALASRPIFLRSP